MKLKTWTLYDGKNLLGVDSNQLINGDVVVLILTPDFVKEKRVLGLAIKKDSSAAKIIDLQNKVLTEEDLQAIFTSDDNKNFLIGFVEMETISELKNDLSKKPIREENILALTSAFNIFFSNKVQEFETNDFADFKNKKPKDTFREFDIKKMPTIKILKSLEAAMNRYHHEQKIILDSQLTIAEREKKIINMSFMQADIIVFFDEALRRTIKEIDDKNFEILKLNKNLENKKGNHE